MQAFNWEDPFNKQHGLIEHISSTFAALTTSDIKRIRAEQKGLLRPLNDIRRAACEVLKHVEGDARRGGPLLVKQAQHEVSVRVLYRAPGNPIMLEKIGPLAIPDHAVVLPADHPKLLPVLSPLFPAQFVSPELDGGKPVIKAAFKDMGIIQRVGLSDEQPNGQVIVVYPNTLHFMANWIRRYRTPISDIRIGEESRPRSVERIHTRFTANTFELQPTGAQLH